MNIDHINWHDSTIRRVIETPGDGTVAFDVRYPVDWVNNVFDFRNILFKEIYAYEIHEGPFLGSPTILDASVSKADQYGVCTIRLDTNAGFRILRCKSLELCPSIAAP